MEFADRAGGLFDQMQERGAELADIMRRDAGRHPDGNARCAIGEQVRKAGGKDDGLAVLAVIGRPEIDGVLVDSVEHRLRHRRQPAFGVTHRGRIIAVDIAEIPLPVDQRITLRKVLCETHQRVIDRELAMRMELADHISDYPRAFLVPGGRVEAELVHRVHDAAMHRLEAIAHIGQGARHDRRQRIGQIALAERIGEVDITDLAGEGSQSHGITSI